MALDQDIRRLAALPMLAQLDPEAVRLSAVPAATRLVRGGDVLFRRGDASDGGFMVTVGSVALDASGEGAPARQVVGPGALIGQRALISALPRPTTAIAREPTTVLKVTRRLFHRVLTEFPESALRVRAHFARDLAKRLAGFKTEG